VRGPLTHAARTRPRWGAVAALLFAAALALSGCYELVFRPQDERDVRNQLHVPRSVALTYLDSYPKEAGWFGREGLQISAEFQFVGDELEEYTSGFGDPEIWKPVRFGSYSPDRADSYSETAFEWNDLPPPPWLGEWLDRWDRGEAVRAIERGVYYGSVIVGERGDRIEHGDGNYHHAWTYRGLACAELDEPPNATILTFAALDLDTGRLYARISFSG
jgi:hypothetical protein